MERTPPTPLRTRHLPQQPHPTLEVRSILQLPLTHLPVPQRPPPQPVQPTVRHHPKRDLRHPRPARRKPHMRQTQPLRVPLHRPSQVHPTRTPHYHMPHLHRRRPHPPYLHLETRDVPPRKPPPTPLQLLLTRLAVRELLRQPPLIAPHPPLHLPSPRPLLPPNRLLTRRKRHHPYLILPIACVDHAPHILQHKLGVCRGSRYYLQRDRRAGPP
jgi:hypothetical protein